MLRESLEEHARERRRYEAHHRVSGEVLAARHGVDRPGLSERIGRHFLEARCYAEALLPLHFAAIERWNASDWGLAHRLLEDYEHTLASLAPSNADPRWAECWVFRARIARTQGRFKDAIAWSERARDHARYFSLAAPLSGALRERALVAHALGDPVTPRPLLEEAESLAADDPVALALAQLGTAEMMRASAEPTAAEERFRAAMHALGKHGEAIGSMSAIHGLGRLAYDRGDHESARKLFDEELAIAERTGSRHAYARAKIGMADLLRLRGNLAPAERAYREAIEILKAIGSIYEQPARASLGLLFLEAGDLGAGHRELMAVRPLADGIEEVRARCFVHASLAADATAYGRWPEVTEQVAQARELVARCKIADLEVARTLELAAEMAHRAGRVEAADQASALARRVWAERRRRNPSAL
jgi:tetratricopeptide (TPR) repeat protein